MADAIETPGAALITPVAEAAPAVAETPATTENDGQVATGPIKFDAFEVPEAQLKMVAAKGWKGVSDMLESYEGLEKLVGLERGDDLAKGRVLIRPKADAKPEEIADFFGKASEGMVPKEAKDYGITAPEGMDPAPFEQAGELFKEAGLPKPFADKLIGVVAAAEKAKVEQFQADSAKQVTDLQAEWGDKYEVNLEAGRRAAAAVGLDGDALNRIELAIGTGPMLKAFAEFGKQYAESSAPKPAQQGAPGQFRETQASAAAKIEALNKDDAFQARFLSPNPAVRQPAIAEMEALLKIAYPTA